MKRQHFAFLPGLAIAMAMAGLAQAQVVTSETETTTTTSLGTVTTINPSSLVLQTETKAAPLRYTFTKTTQYVDEAGNPVSIETVKAGVPVTVHYVKDGERIVANRVVVRSPDRTTIKTITAAGTVSELAPGVVIVRQTETATPLRYAYTKTTRYVDETGAPITIEQVKTGRPVTVHYVKEGDKLVAQRIVVRSAPAAVPPPQVIEERTTTTTTETTGEKKRVKDDDDDDDDEDDD